MVVRSFVFSPCHQEVYTLFTGGRQIQKLTILFQGLLIAKEKLKYNQGKRAFWRDDIWVENWMMQLCKDLGSLPSETTNTKALRLKQTWHFQGTRLRPNDWCSMRSEVRSTSCRILESKTSGNSLAVQWLGLHAFTTRGWVQSLSEELGLHKPCDAAKKKETQNKLKTLDFIMSIKAIRAGGGG